MEINAQALASKDLDEISSLYLRPGEEILVDEVSSEDSDQIPVIDTTKLLDHHELSKLHSACKEWGVFQLTNHGVSEEVMEKIKSDTWEFFHLPLPEKNAFAKQPNGLEGYWAKEALKVDHWAETLFIVARPESQRNMTLCPTNPNSFGESLDKFARELQKLMMCLLNFMSMNLGFNLEILAGVFENGRQSTRMNFYPNSNNLLADTLMGLSPHSDINGMTLLVQVNDVQSLQINKSGKWLPVRAIPGAFIVFIGDAIEVLSNGEYKSVEHRVVVDPERSRLSIATIFSPGMEAIVGPLPDLLKGNKAKYKSFIYGDYLRKAFAQGLKGKSRIDEMKLGH